MNQMSPQERTAVATHQPLTLFSPMKPHRTLVYYQNYTFTIGPPLDEIQSPPNSSLNWKHADEETFCKAISEEIEQNQDTHTKMVRELLNQNRNSASESKLDEAVKMIQEYLE